MNFKTMIKDSREYINTVNELSLHFAKCIVANQHHPFSNDIIREYMDHTSGQFKDRAKAVMAEARLLAKAYVDSCD